MTTGETITGTVEARNERGIRVAGEWRNLSRFHPLELPDVGAAVTLEVDAKGFLTRIEQTCAQAPEKAVSQRDRTISRLAVLKAAAHFSAGRSDIKSADVLAIAERWLAWIEQL